MIFDTDILVWYFRGNGKAALVIDRCESRKISTITYLELLQGAKNKRETKSIKDFLPDYLFQTIPLSENIGTRAIVYMEQYALKTGMCLSDAIIAATVVESNEVIYTGNIKHYKLISGLDLKTFRV
ncbi:MAG: type II toxin-antitoxin system VapC family toxin [Candidatus Anammoxibacter sp.]